MESSTAPPAGEKTKEQRGKEALNSVLTPVLSSITSFSPVLLAEGMTIDPRSDPEQYFSDSWIDDASNAPYQAAAQALAARDDDVQLHLLRPKQRAVCLILQRMEESLARASDQARASLAVVAKANYQSLVHQSFVDISNALEMHWAGGERGKEGRGVRQAGGEESKGGTGGGGEGGVEITPIADVQDFDNQHGMWMRSLAFLNLVLGVGGSVKQIG